MTLKKHGVLFEKEQDKEVEEKTPVPEKRTDALDNIQVTESKNTSREASGDEEKLGKLLDTSNQVLYQVSTFFPLDLFPDKIIIDPNKVSIVKSSFFYSGRIHSIFIDDIEDVFVETGPLFATLHIVDRGFVENTIDIKRLRKADALRARRIIQGLLIAKKSGVDVLSLKLPDLMKRIEELGKMREASSG